MSCDVFKTNAVTSDYVNMRAGSYTRLAQRETDDKTICRVDFYMCKYGSPTGTANVRIRDATTDAILQTSSTPLDVSTLPSCTDLGPTWVAFLFNLAVNATVRFSVEFAGGNSSNYIRVYYNKSDTIDGSLSLYTTGPWVNYATWDATIRVYELVPALVMLRRLLVGVGL